MVAGKQVADEDFDERDRCVSRSEFKDWKLCYRHSAIWDIVQTAGEYLRHVRQADGFTDTSS